MERVKDAVQNDNMTEECGQEALRYIQQVVLRDVQSRMQQAVLEEPSEVLSSNMCVCFRKKGDSWEPFWGLPVSVGQSVSFEKPQKIITYKEIPQTNLDALRKVTIIDLEYKAKPRVELIVKHFEQLIDNDQLTSEAMQQAESLGYTIENNKVRQRANTYSM